MPEIYSSSFFPRITLLGLVYINKALNQCIVLVKMIIVVFVAVITVFISIILCDWKLYFDFG